MDSEISINSKRKSIKRIGEDIAARLFVHFEKRSTRITTATREEVLIDLPNDIKDILSDEDIFSFYDYWRG